MRKPFKSDGLSAFFADKKKVTLAIRSRYANAILVQKGSKLPLETIGY